MLLTVSFQGLDADNHHIEAYSGIESAAGLARTLTLIAHYAATGVVRHRWPFSDNAQVFLEGTEDGSFNWKMALTVVGAPLAIGLSTNAIYDLTKLVLVRAIGEEHAPQNQQIIELSEKKSGDIDALVEAVEPALKKAHYGIDQTATKITISDTTTKSVVVEFDGKSKSYLMDNVDGGLSEQDVSVSSLNANDRTGRAYFLDLKRTIPFRVDRDAAPGTMAVLSASLDQYVNRNPAPVRLYFKRIETTDGRLKRVEIHRAEDVSDDD
jgi:hypothetical protein